MDWNTLIAASITAFASIFVFIGSEITTSRNNKKISRTILQKEQLHKIIEPIVKMLNSEDEEVSTKVAVEIGIIINDNYTIAPVALINEYNRLTKSDKKEISRLKDVAYSYYNWIKKQLQYPYENIGINITCLDNNEALNAIVQYLSNVSITIFVSMVMFIIILLLDYYQKTLLCFLIIIGIAFFAISMQFYIQFNFCPRIWVRGLRYKIKRKRDKKSSNQKAIKKNKTKSIK